MDATPIVPTFTMTWLDGKLDGLFGLAVIEAMSGEASEDAIEAYSNTLAFFDYEGMKAEEIYHAIHAAADAVDQLGVTNE